MLGDIYGDNFVDNLMPSVQIKAKHYIFKKNIKERVWLNLLVVLCWLGDKLVHGS